MKFEIEKKMKFNKKISISCIINHSNENKSKFNSN